MFDINDAFNKAGELLQSGQYSDVYPLCDEIIRNGYDIPEVYLLRLLAEANKKDLRELANLDTPLQKCQSFQKAVSLSDSEMSSYLRQCNEASISNYNQKQEQLKREQAEREQKNNTPDVMRGSMKAVVCELCGSNEIIKDGGFFVCQHCGTKYTLEEARKMMFEGKVDVSGSTVRVDNSSSVQNYLDIGNNALLAGNGQQAEQYANKALEVDPRNSEAWKLKMKSYESTATLGDLQVSDVLAAGKNVIEFAYDKNAAEEEIYKYYLTRSLELFLVSTSKMKDVEDIKSTYHTFMLVSLLTAGANTMKADSKIVSIYEGVATSAELFALAVPDSAVEQYDGLAQLLKMCAEARAKQTKAVEDRFAVYGAALTSEAKKARKEMYEKLLKRAQDGWNNYIKNHPDFKDKIYAEIEELSEKKRQAVLQQEQVAGGAEYDQIDSYIKSLEKKIKDLGMFKGKEKKPLQDEMDYYKKQLKDLEPSVKSQRDEIQKEIDELDKKIKEANDRLTL